WRLCRLARGCDEHPRTARRSPCAGGYRVHSQVDELHLDNGVLRLCGGLLLWHSLLVLLGPGHATRSGTYEPVGVDLVGAEPVGEGAVLRGHGARRFVEKVARRDVAR